MKARCDVVVVGAGNVAFLSRTRGHRARRPGPGAGEGAARVGRG